MQIHDLPTPALIIDADAFERNLASMATRLPGRTLRPHVKAHKCTSIAAAQVAAGHDTFTCATPREIVGMADAGVGADLLLANETVDSNRLRQMAAADAPVTIAVDSAAITGSVAGEIVARVTTDAFADLHTAPIRVAQPDIPEPTSPGLTEGFHVSARTIAEAALASMGAEIPMDIAALDVSTPHDVPGPWFSGPF